MFPNGTAGTGLNHSLWSQNNQQTNRPTDRRVGHNQPTNKIRRVSETTENLRKGFVSSFHAKPKLLTPVSLQSCAQHSSQHSSVSNKQNTSTCSQQLGNLRERSFLNASWEHVRAPTSPRTVTSGRPTKTGPGLCAKLRCKIVEEVWGQLRRVKIGPVSVFLLLVSKLHSRLKILDKSAMVTSVHSSSSLRPL